LAGTPPFISLHYPVDYHRVVTVSPAFRDGGTI